MSSNPTEHQADLETHKFHVERRFRYIVTVRAPSREEAERHILEGGHCHTDLDSVDDPVIIGGGEDERGLGNG